MSKKLSKATLLKQVQKNREYHNEYMKKARRQGRYQKPKDWVQETTKEGIHLKFDCRWLHKLLQKNQNLNSCHPVLNFVNHTSWLHNLFRF